MIRISPATPAVPLADQRRDLNRIPRQSRSGALEGEVLEQADATPAQPPPLRFYDRRRGLDRRQQRTAKPYLDVRCTKDRRRAQRSRIDIEI